MYAWCFLFTFTKVKPLKIYPEYNFCIRKSISVNDAHKLTILYFLSFVNKMLKNCYYFSVYIRLYSIWCDWVYQNDKKLTRINIANKSSKCVDRIYKFSIKITSVNILVKLKTWTGDLDFLCFFFFNKMWK